MSMKEGLVSWRVNDKLVPIVSHCLHIPNIHTTLHPMQLPQYQRQLIESMRNGSQMWADSFGKTTYHMWVRKVVKTIDRFTVATLIYRGLITDKLELTDKGRTTTLM